MGLWWLLSCDGSRDAPHPPPTGDDSVPATADTATDPVDADGDGFTADEDCDDSDPEVFPGAPERCNGTDDDCDGKLHPYADQDNDGDGFPWCEDCNDLDPTAHPGVPDPLGDGVDQDCDGTDGVGTPLPPPALRGADPSGLFGFALDAADFDGDGTDDLIVGQPGIGGADKLVSLVLGGGAAPSVFTLQDTPVGYDVELQPGLVAIHAPLYRTYLGRVLLYDETFGPGAQPVLDVIGDGGVMALHAMALLGEPPQWLLTGGDSAPGYPLQFDLLALPRTGTVDYRYGDLPDVTITTDTESYLTTVNIGPVGDRDGDGLPDLAIGMPYIDSSLYCFGAVESAHLPDAPEIWRAQSSLLFGLFQYGGGDLDGDGDDDGVVVGGGEEYSLPGRVYLLPWVGPGLHDPDTDATATIEGDLSWDWTGNDAEVADLDGDGQEDLVVGAPGDFNLLLQGKVMVFLGPLQGRLTRSEAAAVYVGALPGDHAGAALAVGDFDGSGRLDIAVGAPFVDGEYDDMGNVSLLTDPF